MNCAGPCCAVVVNVDSTTAEVVVVASLVDGADVGVATALMEVVDAPAPFASRMHQ